MPLRDGTAIAIPNGLRPLAIPSNQTDGTRGAGEEPSVVGKAELRRLHALAKHAD